MEQGYTQETLEEGVFPRLWVDTHLLERKIETNYGFKRWPVPSQNQGVSSWTQGPRLSTKISFKGGSHLGNPKLSFFLASLISGTRFLLRVVVCNIPRFYQILGNFFCFYFAYVDWKFTGIWNFLSLFKSFIRKLFQTLNYFLKNSFKKIEFPNTTFHSFKPMQAYLHRKYL
jgi:hypothetical protein